MQSIIPLSPYSAAYHTPKPIFRSLGIITPKLIFRKNHPGGVEFDLLYILVDIFTMAIEDT